MLYKLRSHRGRRIADITERKSRGYTNQEGTEWGESPTIQRERERESVRGRKTEREQRLFKQEGTEWGGSLTIQRGTQRLHKPRRHGVAILAQALECCSFWGPPTVSSPIADARGGL